MASKSILTAQKPVQMAIKKPIYLDLFFAYLFNTF